MGLRKPVILVVDDVADDRIMARMILEKNGFSVVEASNWKEALVKVREGALDLVVLDIHMPELDGIELLGIIRRENSNQELPVILYTSTGANQREKYDNKGADAFITKYESPCVLVNKIRELLQTKTQTC
ncbi:MAG: response regulator [Pseudomonadota bacterium]